MNLSAHFTLEELTRSQTAARLGIDNSPGELELEHLKVLCEMLEVVRAAIGSPLVVSSGFRSKKLNSNVPGASLTSAHTLGYAADFHVVGMAPFELCTHVAGIRGLKFDQLIYEYDSWCHLSADPRARGQVLTKKLGQSYEVGLWA